MASSKKKIKLSELRTMIKRYVRESMDMMPPQEEGMDVLGELEEEGMELEGQAPMDEVAPDQGMQEDDGFGDPEDMALLQGQSHLQNSF